MATDAQLSDKETRQQSPSSTAILNSKSTLHYLHVIERSKLSSGKNKKGTASCQKKLALNTEAEIQSS